MAWVDAEKEKKRTEQKKIIKRGGEKKGRQAGKQANNLTSRQAERQKGKKAKRQKGRQSSKEGKDSSEGRWGTVGRRTSGVSSCRLTHGCEAISTSVGRAAGLRRSMRVSKSITSTDAKAAADCGARLCASQNLRWCATGEW